MNGIKGLKETIDNERKKIAAADILSKKQEEQESVGKTTGQEDLQKEYAKKLDKLLEQIKMIKAEAEASGIVLQHWDDFIKILKTQHENYVDALKGAIKLAQNKFAARDFLKTYRDDISDMKKNLEGLYELPQFKTLVGVLAGVQEKFSKEILAMIAKGSTGKIPSTLLDTWKKKYAFTKGGIEDLIKRIDALRKEIATRSTSDFLSQIKAGKQLRPVNAPAETVISTPIPAPVAPVQVPQEKPSPKKTPEIKEPVELPQSGALINTSSKTLYYCVGTQREMDLVRKSTESLSKAFKPLYPKAVVSLKFDIDAPPHIYLTDKDLAVKGTPAAPINPVLKPTDQINVFYSIQPGVNMYVQADSSVISGLSVKPVDNGKMVGSMQVSNNITSKQLIKEKIKVQDLIK